jgi:hypothetical protein
MSETYAEPDGPERLDDEDDDDDLLDEQEELGYGADEGEREESLPPE